MTFILSDLTVFPKDGAQVLIRDDAISSITTVQKFVQKNKPELVVYDIQNGKWFEKMIKLKIPSVAFNAESNDRKDYARQTDSGLDLPFAKLLSEKGIAYGFCSEILQKSATSRSYLARIAQNKLLLKKAKTKIVLFSENGELSSELFDSL